MEEEKKPENPVSSEPVEPAPGEQAGERLRRLTQAGADDEITPPPAAPAAEEAAAPEAQPPEEPPAQPPADDLAATHGWYGDDGVFMVEPPVKAGDTQPNPAKPPVMQPPEQPTIPPPAHATLPVLPHRTEETDLNATRVTAAAYQPPNQHPPRQPVAPVPPPQRPVYPQQPPAQQPYYPQAQRPPYSPPPAPPQRPPAGRPMPSQPPAKKPRGRWGCLMSSLVGLLFLLVIGLVGIGSFLVIQYFSIAASLPGVDDLRQHTSQFETTRIVDRNNNVLYEVLDPNSGRRTYVPLKQISPYVIATTLATEDKDYYTHPGFDLLAIARALWQNYTTGEVVSGASTITQQLARTLLLPDEKYVKTTQRKAREIVLAAEITRKYSKDEILELYLNEIYYGNLSYGIEAAAETYFNTTADKLTLEQAAFLAGLPQTPGIYDIFTNRTETLNRFKQVLVLTYQLSQERNCIEVSNATKPICVDAGAVAKAADDIEKYNFKRRGNTMRYPHWVTYIRAQLEEKFDAQTIYRSGFTVYTTLDPTLQDLAQSTVRTQVEALADRQVTDGALVAIQPSTGEILAMVGSPNFNDDAHSGQVNMAISPRQPGSSIKPLTYTAAFEKGWTPATLIWDVPSEFPPSGNPDDQREPYKPVNYDGRFHGPVTVRTALSNSYNIPAVKALQFVGIYDDPETSQADGFINFAKRMGITTLTRNDYGLSLTLGGGDVSLLEMTSAFGTFANGGLRMPPVAITKIVDHQGKVVYEYKPPAPEQVIRAEHAYLISSILSDNTARTPMFGANSVLNLPFEVAAKTGTTNDFRDNWTMGYTPDLVTGVWVGNADYTPMINTTGLTGAAPIWSAFMQEAVPQLTGGNPTPFSRPAGVVERVICEVSGTEPSEWCPSQRNEVFAYDQLPPKKDQDLWQKMRIDTWSGLKASAYCSEFTAEKFVFTVKDTWARKWLKEDEAGKAWLSSMGFDDTVVFAPEKECKEDSPHATIRFANLSPGQTVTEGPLDIYAVISATANFQNFTLQWGRGEKPTEWKTLVDKRAQQYKDPEQVFSWDLANVKSGKITLRIYVRSSKGTYAEKRITLNMVLPTATPTDTPEPTITLTPRPTRTPRPTVTPSPTETEPPLPIPTTATP